MVISLTFVFLDETRYQDDLHYQASMVESSYTTGEIKGFEKGRTQGPQEGGQKKATEIAKNFLDILDDKTITAKTGLSAEKIAALREKS